MKRKTKNVDRFLKAIFHPTDYSKASEIAFVHALKLALLTKSGFDIFHVASNQEEDHWIGFPGVRQTLERWGVLPEGSAKTAVADLGVLVEKTINIDKDPSKSILGHLEAKHADIIVLATHQRDGFARWVHKAIAEPIARRFGEMTLFVPHENEGFVSLAEGAITLKNVLIPIDNMPDPQLAIDLASRFVQTFECSEVTFTTVYIGNKEDMPEININEHNGWKWEQINRPGDIVNGILELANELPADLIVMATRGHHGFLDAFRGSTTERVLRGSRCPVLAIPNILYANTEFEINNSLIPTP